ncbi:GNAT family N-acetyltransferase [Metabacillus sp. JX24]|uniref:GNAT family N-acetyltransferase n=1 Tax=Metabacillus sp. JX24 TaxID=3240759 RepID=UPI0035102C7D
MIDETLLHLVQFEQQDIPDLIDLSQSVGWDYDEREIGTVISSGTIFGHKNSKGKIVSSAAIIPGAASIGMVIVDEMHRGMGLGKEATQKCIDSVPETCSVMLISTPEGRNLYEKMGFTPVSSVHKFFCENYLAPAELTFGDVILEDFKEIDLNQVVKIDERAFGAGRSVFLRHRLRQAAKCIVAKNLKGDVIGYGAAVSGPENVILGPIVAPDSQIAALLTDRLASLHHGKLRMDVPEGNKEFMQLLMQRGFRRVSNPPIMVIRSMAMPARNQTLFGIAAQVFG